jgi:S-DNA-T family DNA segregation ATPase FtsK/SpoIIIE
LRTELGAVAILGFGLLLLLSVLSYHPSDSQAGLWGAGGEVHIHNWVGPFGASVSELFVSILGITAFLLPILLGVLVFGMLGRRDRSLLFWEATSFLGVVTSVSVMVHLLFPALAFRGGSITGGGFLGDVLGGGLVAWTSEPGTWVLSVTVFLICSRVCFGVKYVEIAKTIFVAAWRSTRSVLSGVAQLLTSRVRAMNSWRAEVLEDWRYERQVAREERQWQIEDRQAELADEVRDRDMAYEGDAARYQAEADLERGGTLGGHVLRDEPSPIETTFGGSDSSQGGSRVQLPDELEFDPALVAIEPASERLVPSTEAALREPSEGVLEEAPGDITSEEEAPELAVDEPAERVDSMIGAAARGVVHAELKVGKRPMVTDPAISDSRSSSDVQSATPLNAPITVASETSGLALVEPDASGPPATKVEGSGPQILSSASKEEGAAFVERAVSMRRKIRMFNEPFEHPGLSLLEMPPPERVVIDETELEAQAERLETTLRTFGVEGRVVNILPGPVITMFEFEPAPGTRVAKIANLGNDLALALKAVKVRIVAPIPGKGAVGIEIPSAHREMVYFREVLASKVFREGKAQLPLAMGKGIDGSPVTSDLAKMPHMIVAGTTGSGKSVCVNTLILSLLYSRSPDEVRLVLVDPKILEFSIYEGIPHLLTPVVTSPKKAAMALKWAVEEMERRYQVLSAMNARNIVNYNEKTDVLIDQWEAWEKKGKKASERPECGRQAGEDSVSYRSRGGDPVAAPDKMPYIVIIIDELADLMMVAKKDVEESIVRLAQKARASGIHMVLATQRPTVDVVTGLIKANFPSRLAFRVSQKNDSRVILDVNGAEALLGLGDGLFLPPGGNDLVRVHGAFVSDDEVLRVVDYLKTQGTPDYIDLTVDEPEDDDSARRDPNEKVDAMYDECTGVVAREGKASTSLLQRKLGLGYNRAARIMDMMEREGVIGPQNGAKPREVFVKPFEF